VLRPTAALVIKAGFYVIPVPLDVRGFHLVRARGTPLRPATYKVAVGGQLLHSWSLPVRPSPWFGVMSVVSSWVSMVSSLMAAVSG
jgi:hypothetical protein